MKLSGSTSFFFVALPFEKCIYLKNFLSALCKTERRHKSLNDDQVVVVFVCVWWHQKKGKLICN